MSTLSKKEFLINITYATVILGISFGIFRFATGYLAPFIIGFLIATLVKPFVTFTRRIFGDRKLLQIGIVILFYIFIGAIIFWATLRFIAYVQMMLPVVESFYDQTLYPALTEMARSAEAWVTDLDPNVASIVDTALNEINQTLISIAKSGSALIVSWITGLMASLPNLFVAILITIISSFFFTIDYQNIVGSTLSVLSPKTRQFVLDVKNLFSILIGKYLKSYLIIISVTFVELSIGFLIIRLPNAIMIAGLVALIDILPVIGTGTVLIPWIIYSFIIGDVHMAIGLSIIYAIVTVVRNILEPKVIGNEIGLHPVATLISIFVGLRFFGFWGLFGVPIFVTIISTLHREGKIDFFKFFGFRNDYGQEIE